ncbi:MAG: EF-hand domain-containing protein [Pelagimonas sp.]|nr:EF-hand domain-containing protein [Pelagimonas sp.]
MKKPVLMITGAVALALGLAGMASAEGKHGGKGPRGGAMMFEQMDLNKDGQITKEEVAQAKAKRFTDADADSDGFLTADELKAHAQKQHADRAAKKMERRIAKMIERTDTDNDGKISAAEAEAAASSDKRADKMFAKLDTNEDGVITKEEAEAARKEMRGKWGGKRKGGHDHDDNN